MLNVTIELHSAVTLKKSNIGYIEIINDDTGTRTRGNYVARLYRRGSKKTIWKEVRLRDFPRQTLTSYDLLYRVLKEAVGERNKGI